MANTAATSPSTMADDATVGTVAWSNPDNAKVSDNVYATASPLTNNVQTHRLLATNFGFSIPAGATINGIFIEVEGMAGINNNLQIAFGYIKTGVTPTNNSNQPQLTTTNSYYSCGGSTNLLGQTWTPADINATGFGANVKVKNNGWVGSDTASVDHIRMTVYYTEAAAAGPANLKSYNTNLKANIKSIDTNLIANVKSLNTNV